MVTSSTTVGRNSLWFPRVKHASTADLGLYYSNAQLIYLRGPRGGASIIVRTSARSFRGLPGVRTQLSSSPKNLERKNSYFFGDELLGTGAAGRSGSTSAKVMD